MDTFCEQLNKELQVRGLRQADLVRATGISEVTISRYVNGKRVPTMSNAQKIAEALGVSVDYLFKTEPQDLTVPDLLAKLDILSNDHNLPIMRCLEYRQAKLVIQEIFEGRRIE